MTRLFDDRPAYRSSESVGWTPSCDIFEDEDGVTLRFELAGVDPKDVDIRFENGVLTLRGERKLEKEDKRDNYHRVELAYGTSPGRSRCPAPSTRRRSAPRRRTACSTVHLPKRPRRSRAPSR